MGTAFDHVTFVVQDLEEAKEFFGLLGFAEDKAVVASGETMSNYMGIPDWKSDHVTLVLSEAGSRQEVQLLRFHHPPPLADPKAGDLTSTGFNHLCFRVDDLDSTLGRLEAHGVRRKNDVMDFHDRRLVFLEGPEKVTIELAQWLVAPEP